MQIYFNFLFYNQYFNTISQYSFISFVTCVACPLLELKYSMLLIRYSQLHSFYYVKKGKYSIPLLFLEGNSWHILLLWPVYRPYWQQVSYKENEKQQELYWLVIHASFYMNSFYKPEGGHTQTHIRIPTYQQI